MEYIVLVTNTISQRNWSSIFENIDQILNPISSLFSLVVIVIGLSWIKPLKEKQCAASFTFWSQLHVRLVRIEQYLLSYENELCFLYMYSPTATSSITSTLSPDPENYIPLFDVAEETLKFLKKANDQMPPYAGWTSDYNQLLNYLTDIIVFDIRNSNAHFKSCKSISFNDCQRPQKEMYNLISKMNAEIVSKQISIEQSITVVWYKRLCQYLRNLFQRIMGRPHKCIGNKSQTGRE